jgi:hypothetical protein
MLKKTHATDVDVVLLVRLQSYIPTGHVYKLLFKMKKKNSHQILSVKFNFL